jgi:pimeloyl-ACP methyl ester carboxylesterase
VTNVQERSVEIDGLRIHTREVGEGSPVLLINGLGANTSVWSTLETTLAGQRLIQFDAPGTGHTKAPLRPVSVSRLARIAAAVLDSAGVTRADVLGYSMGGIIAQQLAADAPERVRRLVLTATTPGLGGITSDPKSLLHLAVPLRYISPRMYAKSLGGLVGGRARTDEQWALEMGRSRLDLSPSMRGYFGQMLSLAGWTGLPLLKRIKHPALVVAGTDDPLAPLANAMLLAHWLPRGRLLVAPEEGHLMPVDPQSVVHAPIREFLTSSRLDASTAWRSAQRVSHEELQAAIVAQRQAQPMGAIGGLVRSRLLPRVVA